MGQFPTSAIRRAVIGDAGRLHDLAAQTFALACPPGTRREDIDAHISSTLSEARMREYLTDSHRELFLAEVHGEASGYTMLVFEEPTDPDVRAAVTRHPTAELSKCYVLPGFHGSGVAARLMEATVTAAAGRGAASVWLGVNALNARADAFYARCGFERAGTRRYLVGSEWHDDIVRERVLDTRASGSAAKGRDQPA